MEIHGPRVDGGRLQSTKICDFLLTCISDSQASPCWPRPLSKYCLMILKRSRRKSGQCTKSDQILTGKMEDFQQWPINPILRKRMNHPCELPLKNYGDS